VRNGPASPKGNPHEQRCDVDADEIGVFEPMAEPGIEGCHQELRVRAWCRVGRGGGGEVGEDQDFDDGSAEGPDSPISAAMVARAEPRFLASAAIAV
jgi:hypothetical protein